MTRRRGQEVGTPASCSACCCRLVAVVSVDARGQMVLPKALRDAAGIAPGAKLAITAWEKDGSVACLTLSRADDLALKIEELLSPVLAGSLQSDGARRAERAGAEVTRDI